MSKLSASRERVWKMASSAINATNVGSPVVLGKDHLPAPIRSFRSASSMSSGNQVDLNTLLSSPSSLGTSNTAQPAH